jgi:TonB family protein
MFDIFLPEDGTRKKNVRKAVTFTLSVLIHAATIAAVIVVPLLRAEASLPGFKVIDAALIAPPILPGVPSAGSGGRGKHVAGPGEAKPRPDHPRGPIVLRAPIEVPTKIEDEDIADLPGEEYRPGVNGAPDEGSETWEEMGRRQVSEEIDLHALPVTTIRPPRLIKRVNPDYSPTAIAARVSGPVVIAAVTDIYGRVREARVVSGHALLSAAALEAVREWLYEPYLVNGIPKPVSFTVTVIFSLENR